MAAPHQVEQHVVAGAIEDHLTVASGDDRDGTIGGGLQRQRERAVEWRHLRIDVVRSLGTVQPGVHHDPVAGLRRPLPDHAPVAEAGPVVGLQQAGETGLLAWPLVVGRVDVQGAPAVEGLWLATRADPHETAGLTRRAVGIREPEPAFVLGVRRQAEDAAGKSRRHDVFEMFPLPEHALAADAHERQRDPPIGLADGAELDGDCRVAIVVALDAPLEAEVVEGRMLDDELAGLGAVLSCCRRGRTGDQHGNGDETEAESMRHGRSRRCHLAGCP